MISAALGWLLLAGRSEMIDRLALCRWSWAYSQSTPAAYDSVKY
jgi:hypothetical protein